MVSLAVSLPLFVVGLAIVIFFAEKMVKGAVGTSMSLGLSSFLVSVVFIGFDPENLAVGAVAAARGASGLALGSIVGATMVAIALAFGITVLVVPMRFQEAPRKILIVPILAVLLLTVLGLDGILSRLDGVVLLLAFLLSVLYLLGQTRRGVDIRPAGEVAETLEEAEEMSKSRALLLLLGSLFMILLGSELLVGAAKVIVGKLGVSGTVFGMTILAFLVSVEELARELPAAYKGKPEISYGNVVGSVLAFFLFNAGIIALVHPVSLDADVLHFYLPLCIATVLVVSFFMQRMVIPRWAGAILLLLYAIFSAGGYIG